MFLLGIFYDVYQRAFFAKGSGGLMLCIGVALIPQMIGIEAQMASYVGGILQQVLLTLVVFLPVIRLSKKGINQVAEEAPKLSVPNQQALLLGRHRLS